MKRVVLQSMFRKNLVTVRADRKHPPGARPPEAKERFCRNLFFEIPIPEMRVQRTATIFGAAKDDEFKIQLLQNLLRNIGNERRIVRITRKMQDQRNVPGF